jgi:galactofuranosylgalactofuranosylrhamnosyl-N-acetylglucosaminyl-diphospho-decaprenol beta-1,5/1,6-galactofuranosyltransferase
MLGLARRGGAVLWRLMREGERAREKWRAALPELADRETWTRLFGTR